MTVLQYLIKQERHHIQMQIQQHQRVMQQHQQVQQQLQSSSLQQGSQLQQSLGQNQLTQPGQVKPHIGQMGSNPTGSLFGNSQMSTNMVTYTKPLKNDNLFQICFLSWT